MERRTVDATHGTSYETLAKRISSALRFGQCVLVLCPHENTQAALTKLLCSWFTADEIGLVEWKLA